MDVIQQLYDTVSIYGNDGIFKELEQKVKEVLERPTWHSLLLNSGSNALSALYYACNLQPGDKVSLPKNNFNHRSCAIPIY
jgi:dTDP-4-amino-4,6-dideoxygalactose transaminase